MGQQLLDMASQQGVIKGSMKSVNGGTDPHAGNLTIRRGTFARLPDNKEEKWEQAEYIRQCRIEPIRSAWRIKVFANLVKLLDCQGRKWNN
jgi:hypothetical protein